MDKFLRKNYKIVNNKIIIIFMFVGMFFSSSPSYIEFEDIKYNLSKSDIIFYIFSNRTFSMLGVLLFLLIIFYCLFAKSKSELEMIRYTDRQSEYKEDTLNILKFVILYIGIIFINIFLSSSIKGNNDIGFSNTLNLLYSNIDNGYLWFMNKEILLYNPKILIFLFSIILILFYFFIANILNILNIVFKNKLIILIFAISLSNLITYDSNFNNGTSLSSYLFLNHIDINYNGFSLFSSKYLNMLTSIIYLGGLNLVLILVGMKLSKNKEIFPCKSIKIRS